MDAVFIGIDTSCYTTSLAVCNIAGDILVNKKILLPVEKNQRGLRQSEAVFLHIKNMQDVFEEIKIADLGKIGAVAASVRPRPRNGSYMPVFMVSKCIAAAVSSVTGAFFIETTHQHAHIAAARIHNELCGDFIAVHLSGGTSELLSVREEKNGQMKIIISGRTLDLPAGQLVDRIGQRIGFSFPCGPPLEMCAKEGEGTLHFKKSVKNTDFHFSGVEAQANRVLDTGEKPQEVCLAVQEAIAHTVAQAALGACKKENISQVLFFGGVMSNEYIKDTIKNNPACKNLKLIFAQKGYSADNAAGLAVMARDQYTHKEEL